MKNKTKHSSSGFSLIEVTVAIILFTVVILLGMESFWKAESTIRNQDQAMTRMRLIQNLIHIMGMPASLRAAAENTPPGSKLRLCLRGTDCNTLADPFPSGWQPISLYLPPMQVVSATPSVRTSGAISAPPSAGIRYNYDGESCDPGITTCPPENYPITLTTEYQIVCPPLYDTFAEGTHVWTGGPIVPNGIRPHNICQMAQYFKIRYRFTPTDPSSTKYHFKDVTGIIWVSSVSAAYAR